jgi:alpha-N-arabinofuranosidase
MINTVDGQNFGGFLKHMGRSIYGGVYDLNSIHADEDGMRTDVLEVLHQLKMPIERLDRFGLAQFVNLLGTEIQ